MATPLVTATLHLDSWAAAALIGVTAVPLTVMGGQAGVLQGERRWGPLAGDLPGRRGWAGSASGSLALLVEPEHARRDDRRHRRRLGPGADRLVGAAAPGPRERAGAPGPPRSAVGRGGVLGRRCQNSYALLAFFALSNADVIIARSTLDEHQAGLYAGGLILTKAVLFLPQFVVVIAFPSMSTQDAGSGRTWSAWAWCWRSALVAVARHRRAVRSSRSLFVGGAEYAGLRAAVGVRR